MSDHPVVLNGRDDEGRVIYLSPDGSAYVELRHGEDEPTDGPPQPPEMPGPGGMTMYPHRAVPTPAHMQDEAFRQHPGAELFASEDGTRCVYLYRQGNPPMPPQPCLAPACAAEWAAAYRAGTPRTR